MPSADAAEIENKPERSVEVGAPESIDSVEVPEASVEPEVAVQTAVERAFPGEAAPLPPEVISDPELKAHAEAVRAAEHQLHEGVLQKVSEQLGSNEGGWYEDTSTNDRYYVKFYKNSDQARVEFLTNAIYRKLGIAVPESQLLSISNRVAIAAKEIPNAQPTYREEQRASAAVRSGFVADAYLANWDVVGLVYDNIVRDADGQMVRIDNGGALTFRAQGGKKDFPPDAIAELQNMLNPEYPAGSVFAGLTSEEMKTQAEKLVRTLTPAEIDRIMEEADLPPELASTLRTGLIGRRRVLMERFGIQERRQPRMARVFEGFEKDRETLEVGLRPRESILSDADHIENQEIDFIDTRQEGHVTASFKLTYANYTRIRRKLNEMASEGAAEEGEIAYTALRNRDERYKVAVAWILQHEGLTIKVSQGYRTEGRYSDEVNGSAEDKAVRASLGLVNIEIPVDRDGEEPDVADLELKVADAMQRVFGIEDGIAPPSAEAERKYKEARYRWHHKMGDQTLSAEDTAAAMRLERKEVYPGYFTMVDSDRHKEYEKEFGRIAVYHGGVPLERVATVVKLGLLSSHERFRRGMILHGMSSEEDFKTGGADSVFTRTITDGSREKRYSASDYLSSSTYAFVFTPRVLDRSDWYAYTDDEYGSTKHSDMERRLAPRDLLRELSNGRDSHGSNEQMFRTGLDPRDLAGIAYIETGSSAENAIKKVLVDTNYRGYYDGDLSFTVEELTTAWNQGPSAVGEFFAERGALRFFEDKVRPRFNRRMELLEALEAKGVTEINGKPLSEAVIAVNTMEDLLEIANAGKAPANDREANMDKAA